MQTLLLNAAANSRFPCVSPAAIFEEMEELVKNVTVYEFLKQEPLPGGYHENRKFIALVRDQVLERVDDEVRVANPQHWAGAGMNAGKPAAAVMFGMSRAAIMLYSGQEIGEPAIGAEGFSGDDGRTSIFDYTSMPEFQKWFNGGKCDGAKLSSEQTSLRKWYGDLLVILREPAFTAGDFYGLNHANKQNSAFGRVGGETCSGHWLYAFLRRDSHSGQAFLCLANFHPAETLTEVRVIIPEDALDWLGKGAGISFEGKLGCRNKLAANAHGLAVIGLALGDLEALGVRYYALK
jgi:hypothetical protein